MLSRRATQPATPGCGGSRARARRAEAYRRQGAVPADDLRGVRLRADPSPINPCKPSPPRGPAHWETGPPAFLIERYGEPWSPACSLCSRARGIVRVVTLKTEVLGTGDHVRTIDTRDRDRL
jgi:hypothetical protein